MSLAGENLLYRIREHIKKKSWTILDTYVDLEVARSVNHGGILGAAYAAEKEYQKNDAVLPSTFWAFACGILVGGAGVSVLLQLISRSRYNRLN